jgi:hypothetical protein
MKRKRSEEILFSFFIFQVGSLSPWPHRLAGYGTTYLKRSSGIVPCLKKEDDIMSILQMMQQSYSSKTAHLVRGKHRGPRFLAS